MRVEISSAADKRTVAGRGGPTRLAGMNSLPLSGTLYHPLFNETMNYSSQVVGDDADGQVCSTIQLMAQYAREDAQSEGVQRDVQAILRQCGMGAKDEDLVCAVWQCVQGKIKFVRDETVAAPIESFMSRTYEGMNGGRMPSFPTPIVEILVRPRDMATVGKRLGDCDDYAMYAASLLVGLGIPCSFVTMAGDRQHPGEFSHVYVAAYPGGGGKRVAVDASHGKYCGWEGMSVRPGARVQEWPVQGDTTGGYLSGKVLGAMLAAVAIWALWTVTR